MASNKSTKNRAGITAGSSRPVKVLFLSHSHELGGAELALFDMLEYLEAIGYKMEPFFILPGPGEFAGKLDAKNWPYRIISYGPWLWGGIPHHPEDILRERMRNMQTVKHIQAIISKQDIQLVFTNTMLCPWAALAAGLEGIPHVWYVHEFGDDDHGLKFEIGRKKTLSDIGQLSDLVIANSRAVSARLASYIPKSKLTTAYIPYHTEEVEALAGQSGNKFFADEASLKLVFTGRIIGSKGQLEAVEALAELVQQGMNIELCLVGKVQDEDYFSEIKKVIKQFGLSKKVHFAGHVTNPYPIISAADVGLVASRSEAYGRVTFEYLLLSKPVVGSASGGTLEMVENGRTGFLYQPGDHNEMAKQIARYAVNRELVIQHGRAARKKAMAMLAGTHSPSRLKTKLEEITGKETSPKVPSFIGELFDLPSVIKAYYGTTSGRRKNSLPIRALKKVYHKSPKPVRRLTKPVIKKTRKLKGRHG